VDPSSFDPSTSSSRIDLAVPAYVHPAEDPETWTRLAQLGSLARFVVVNVDNGPGAADDPYYPEAVNGLSAAGVRTLGYVDTTYGRRPAVDVLDDVNDWMSRYPLSGIFFDQVSSGLRELDHYDGLVVGARSMGARFVALNPGTFPHPAYVDLANVIVTFEGTWNDYQALREPPWVVDYTPNRFAHLVYAVPPPAERGLHEALALAQAHRVRSFFATSRSLPNPWGELPTPLVDAVRGRWSR
jgi:hypothetical protein